MKTKILISSIAALCLLVTFAEAPRRHGEDKMNSTSTDNISIEIVKRATMLPGVVITNTVKDEAEIAIPANPTEDFTYLKFNTDEYMKDDATNQDETEVLPEAPDADFTYLKFKLSDFTTDSEITGDEITELPVKENNSITVYTPAPVANEFEYLRFNVNEYINNGGTEASEIGELPLAEPQTGKQAEISILVETINEFGYLKFDVTKYYNSTSVSSDEQYELPEE